MKPPPSLGNNCCLPVKKRTNWRKLRKVSKSKREADSQDSSSSSDIFADQKDGKDDVNPQCHPKKKSNRRKINESENEPNDDDDEDGLNEPGEVIKQ